MRILITEDDNNLAENLKAMFKKQNISCDHASSGEDALALMESFTFDLMLLDIMLAGGISGIDVLKKIRSNKIQTPVLILSNLHESIDKIRGLNEGADDYPTKPFNKEELLARINAVIRRSKGFSQSTISIDDLTINLDNKQAFIKDRTIPLTNKEYNILEILAFRQGKVVSKEALLDQLYGGLDEPEPKIIDVFVCKLRKKLHNLSGGKNFIGTIWGQGYTLQDPSKNEIFSDDTPQDVTIESKSNTEEDKITETA
jgi:two-component system cell cycle response regulator CtrA